MNTVKCQNEANLKRLKFQQSELGERREKDRVREGGRRERKKRER
jgi:hypothetical protein